LESTWVRSVYLYAMCAIAVLLVGIGAVTTVIAGSSAISPSLGHRDTLDRVGIGFSNVATDIVNIIADQSGFDRQAVEDQCKSYYDDKADVASCVSEMDPTAQLNSIVKGIHSVRNELESQIRYSAFARIIRGLAMLIVGWLLWRFHAHRTDLYSGGLTSRRGLKNAAAAQQAAAASAAAAAAAASMTMSPPPPIG
jgi:hypothetical protein